MATESSGYPATLFVDYPDRDLNRVTSLLRPFTAIPILVILALVSGPGGDARATHGAIGAGGILFAATALMIVFRQKYPRWWFDWNLALTRLATRVIAYVALMRDEYPPFRLDTGGSEPGTTPPSPPTGPIQGVDVHTEPDLSRI